MIIDKRSLGKIENIKELIKEKTGMKEFDIWKLRHL